MPDGARFAFPPRVLRAAAAAHYCGIGESTFRERVAPALQAVTLAEVKGWLREDLDAWIDRQAGRAPASPEMNPWPTA